MNQRAIILKSTAIICFLILSISSISQDNKNPTPNFYNSANTARTVAEWEPAIGTMIVWPLSIPYKLAVELAKDNHLFTLVVSDSAKLEALEWYLKWGIDTARNTFISVPQGIDSWWVRDWGPSAVFTRNGKMMLADGKYIYSTPVTGLACNDSLFFIYKDKEKNIIKTETDDNATLPLGNGLNIPVLDLPFINTGGNVLTDGLGTAFSTCVLLNENRFYNVPEDKFLQLNKELMGFDKYNILSNFEKEGIQHIDCFMKLLDEERIIVAEPPRDHELFPVYERIIREELFRLKTAYGRPYQILRIKTAPYLEDRLAAYTNSIIINKTIYVPLFQIKADSLALIRWREVMPGYTVKGFSFDFKDEPFVTAQMKDHYRTNYGWDNGDALHCRTRAIWDAEMLFISTKRLEPKVSTTNKNLVYATIIDYSQKGLVKGKQQLIWRVRGETKWKVLPLIQVGTSEQFSAEFPYHRPGKLIEYYITAASNSGRIEMQPRTAPLGTYQFTIQ